MRCAGCVDGLPSLKELTDRKMEDVMDSDTRDPELEWLNARSALSNRAIARILGVHYEAVRRARLTGHLGDALRRNIRAYIEENSGGGEEASQQDDEPRSSGGDLNCNRDDLTGDAGLSKRERRPLSRGRRGGRRAVPGEGRADDDGPTEDEGVVEDERAANEERKSALRLMYEVVGCRDANKLAAITARLRERYGVDGGSLSVAPEPCHTRPTEATLDELKAQALSLLSGVPVVGELPLGAAVSAARAVLNDEVSLLAPPLLLHGDAVLLLVMRAQASYTDLGAREVAFAPAGRRYACVLLAEELRDGVTIEYRMRRYAHDDHWDRPRLIGMRFSDVIPEKPYPDEDWFFGSTGWTDGNGAWRPGRAELIARWRHVGSLCEAWGAGRPTTPWQYALAAERTALELTLLSPEYAMTFDRDILGDARWPTSTRLGHQTQSRRLMLKGYDQAIGRLRRRRMLSTFLLWLPRLALRTIDRLLRRPSPALDGSVCGSRVWKAADPPLTPGYTTPNPFSGYAPSDAFRLRFRRHEFKPERRLKSYKSGAYER